MVAVMRQMIAALPQHVYLFRCQRRTIPTVLEEDIFFPKERILGTYRAASPEASSLSLPSNLSRKAQRGGI